MANLYRKKPVVIEAIKFEYGINHDQVMLFCGASCGKFSKNRNPNSIGEVEIITLEDGHDSRVSHIASNGDFIIKGVNGEFYPCKPDIFEKTYELVGK